MEMNGDVYNCDHFVYPQFKLGNIHQKTLRQMNQGEQNRQFGSDKQRSMAQECHRCQWKFACYGGCPKHRFYPLRQAQPIITICVQVIRLFLAYRDGDECHANPV